MEFLDLYLNLYTFGEKQEVIKLSTNDHLVSFPLYIVV